ncbi:uncharacterized protein LAESUDRAFT_226483 [Laetiporus sulphureus 93-53]|uniref:Uncharacterized protein n=1 Tax=Laetiporus sulphureus 93-53 TaxID=1314785 RepID=A0A165DPT1_9APHY|nr:uncharacterized protein LAESUDRAFT_226483 [Laetiporus sulphureus 93-53]KZT05360.1 hypothetical protein LAESUDRAFT_226483 [Laetiporus sulphureus 93-53]
MRGEEGGSLLRREAYSTSFPRVYRRRISPKQGYEGTGMTFGEDERLLHYRRALWRTREELSMVNSVTRLRVSRRREPSCVARISSYSRITQGLVTRSLTPSTTEEAPLWMTRHDQYSAIDHRVGRLRCSIARCKKARRLSTPTSTPECMFCEVKSRPRLSLAKSRLASDIGRQPRALITASPLMQLQGQWTTGDARSMNVCPPVAHQSVVVDWIVHRRQVSSSRELPFSWSMCARCDPDGTTRLRNQNLL